MVLASRKHVEQYLAGQASRWASKTPPEVWALAGERAASMPITLAGFGEERRYRRFIVLRNTALALILLAAGITAAIVVTPTAQLRLRAIEALAAYTGLQQRTEPLLKQRAAFLQSAERATALGGMLGNRVDVLQSLDVLTKALPDDTSLQMLQVQGTKVTLNGQTSNVAALMQKLSTQTGLKDVKAPSGTARPPGAQKENFTIELQLEPKALQNTQSPSAQQPGTAGAVMAGEGGTGKGAVPAASAPIASMPPANAPAPLAQTTSAASAASVPKAATPVPSPFAIGGSKPAPQGKPVP
jgi:general secretion pathway protein L